MFQQIRKLLISILLILFSCQNKQISTQKPDVAKNIKVLAVQAESRFAISPRKAHNVLDAYKLMKKAASQSSKNNPDRCEYFIRAARFGIWLSYHLDTKIEKSKFANEAISLSKRTIDIDKQRAEGFYYRGIAVGLFSQQNKLLAKNSLNRIRKDLSIAIDLDPAFDHGGPHRVLGALYLRAPGPPAGIGSSRRAVFHLEKAYKISKDYPENLLFLAESYIKIGKFSEAEKMLNLLNTSYSKYSEPTEQKDWRNRAALLSKKLEKPQ